MTTSPGIRVPASRTAAFTLLEILITISIIGILAVLLFPTLRKAQESARSAKCLSNLRQLGLGWRDFINDFDGKLPTSAWRNTSNNTSNPGIRDYLGLPLSTAGDPWQRATVFTCPQLQASPATSTQEPFLRTYGVNSLISGVYDPSAVPAVGQKQRISQIAKPASFALAMDGAYDPSRPANDRYGITVRNQDLTSLNLIQRPHRGFPNVLFVDGHVAPTTPDIFMVLGPASVFWRDEAN